MKHPDIVQINSLARHELVIVFGIVMAFLVLGKLLNLYYLDSDWFWFITALGLSVEGLIALIKQKRFDSKYKILTREEYERLKI